MEVKQPELAIEVRSPPGGRVVATEALDGAHLQPALDDALWRATRKTAADLAQGSFLTTVLPVTATGQGSSVQALDVEVQARAAASAASSTTEPVLLKRRYALQSLLREPTVQLVNRLVAEGCLREGDEYDVSFLPLPRPRRPAPGLEAVVEEAPLAVVDGSLPAWHARSRLLSSEAHHDDDTPVFILPAAFDAARKLSCRAGPLESGAMLVGRLFRQREPEAEVFAVIEAAFEARYAEEAAFSLTLSPETYQDFHVQLERRRRRLRRPEETLVGFAHGHRFLPALAADGTALCPSCPKRPTCALHSAFYSLDDVRFHTSLFRRRTFAVGLVWGLSPREEDVLRVFGFRDGTLQERAIWLAEGV